MAEEKEILTSVEMYLAQFPPDVQGILTTIRAVIRAAAPQAEERISYNMPGYYLNGGLVWFGAYKKHIALYPLTEKLLEQIPELAGHKAAKSSIHFPLNRPIPYELIEKIVQVRVQEMEGK